MVRRAVVLVVEDEPGVQHTLAAILGHLGFTVRVANNIDEAVAVLGTDHIDAITLDVRLPDPQGRTGLTLLSFLRTTSDYRDVPIIVFTGMPLSAEEEDLVQRHGAEVCYKPQLCAVLADRLHQVLASREGTE